MATILYIFWETNCKGWLSGTHSLELIFYCLLHKLTFK